MREKIVSLIKKILGQQDEKDEKRVEIKPGPMTGPREENIWAL
jgi:hypothetical protein